MSENLDITEEQIKTIQRELSFLAENVIPLTEFIFPSKCWNARESRDIFHIIINTDDKIIPLIKKIKDKSYYDLEGEITKEKNSNDYSTMTYLGYLSDFIDIPSDENNYEIGGIWSATVEFEINITSKNYI